MKDLKKKIITYICSGIFSIVFLVLPFILLDQTSKKGTYIGEEGLKTALNALLAGITYKIVMGAILGFVIWMFIYLIKKYTSLGKNKLTDKEDGVKRYRFITSGNLRNIFFQDFKNCGTFF